MDNDGMKDLVFNQHTKPVKFYKGNGTLEPKDTAIVFTIDSKTDNYNDAPGTPYFFDYDNDGDKDLFWMNNGVTYNHIFYTPLIYLENTSSQNKWEFNISDAINCKTEDSIMSFTGSGIHHTIGDFDSDGDMDLIVLTTKNFHVGTKFDHSESNCILYSNLGDFQFELIDTLWTHLEDSLNYDKCIKVAAGDLNNDGVLDLIQFIPSEGLFVAWGKEETSVEDQKLQILLEKPTIANNILQITQNGNTSTFQIIITSTAGKKILTFPVSSESINMLERTLHLGSGVYIVSIKGSSMNYTLRWNRME